MLHVSEKDIHRQVLTFKYSKLRMGPQRKHMLD